MGRTLIVVDMQKDFVDGSLGTKEAQEIVANVEKKIQVYRKNGERIIFTRDTHPVNYLETLEGKHLPVEHCIKGTAGWELDKHLTVKDTDTIIDKPTFGYCGWSDVLSGEDVELIGLCTDICVISNALLIKTAFPKAEVYVDASCCAGVTPDTHKASLETMKMCQVNVIEGE